MANAGRQYPNESKTKNNNGNGLDRGARLTLAHKGMKLKSKGMSDLQFREVSARRQVGDAESVMNDKDGNRYEPWWRNVTMEEGF